MLITQTLPNIFGFSRASKAWDYDTNGNLTEFAVDAIRNGFDPLSRLPAGWLLEGPATNLFPAQVFSSVNSGAQNAALDPLGATTARDFVPNTANVSHYLDRGITGITAGATTGLSVLLQAGNSTRVRLHQYGTGNATLSCLFDLSGVGSAGAVAVSAEYTSGGGSTVGAYIQPVGGGWYRCSIVGVPDTAATSRLCRVLAVDPTGATSTFAGDGVTPAFRYAWPQLEGGGLVTSYIPTPSGVVSRTTETLVCSGSPFAAIFGAAKEGWLICDVLMDVAAPSGGSGRVFAQIDDGSAANRLQLRTNSSANSVVAVTNLAGAQGAAPTGGSAVYGAPLRAGIRWNNGAFSVCANGGALVSATGAPAGGFTALRLGADQSGSVNLFGRMRGVWGGPNGSVADTPFRTACTLGTDPDEVLRT